MSTPSPFTVVQPYGTAVAIRAERSATSKVMGLRYPGQRILVRQIVDGWALLDESTELHEMWISDKFITSETLSSNVVAAEGTSTASAAATPASGMAARIQSLLHDHKTTSFCDGSMVVIEGLSGRPQLNGRSGRVVTFVADKGRFAVELPKRGGQLSCEKVLLRPANLRPAAPLPVSETVTAEGFDLSRWEDEMIELVNQVELTEDDVKFCPELRW